MSDGDNFLPFLLIGKEKNKERKGERTETGRRDGASLPTVH
jgi:hypothetical protein